MINLDSIIKAYNDEFGDSLVEILLFGSYARGDYNADSDIDIAGIVKGERADLQQKEKVIWKAANALGLEYDVIVSPIVIPYDEYEAYKNELPYYRNIMNEGIRLDHPEKWN